MDTKHNTDSKIESERDWDCLVANERIRAQTNDEWYNRAIDNQRRWAQEQVQQNKMSEPVAKFLFTVGCESLRKSMILNDIVEIRTTAESSVKTNSMSYQKLRASTTIEVVQDVDTLHGTDAVDDVARAIAEEIASSIVTEVVTDICDQAIAFPGTSSIVDSIDKAREDIFRTIGKRGNFVICSLTDVSTIILEAGARFVKVKPQDSSVALPLTLSFVGFLDNDIKIYCMPDRENIIVGYRGSCTAETGYIYSHGVPMVTADRSANNVLFQPQLNFRTQCGKTVPVTTHDNPFYRSVCIK